MNHLQCRFDVPPWCFACALLVAIGASPIGAAAQNVAVQGFVTNGETGQPLPGANVVIHSLTGDQPALGAAANGNGYYRIRDVPPDTYALRATFVGYQTVRDTLRLQPGTEPVTYSVELVPSEQRLGEVVVTEDAGGATTQTAGRQRVTQEDLEHLPTPSISGDLTTYLQSLPGVVSVGDRGGELFIRGGTPSQNLVLLDRMQVYRPFHIVGFYSVFPEELVSNADIYAGGFPAKYSGRISSVIDVEMRGGNQERVAGGFTASPFLTGLRVEGPLNDEGISLLSMMRFSHIERTSPTLVGTKQPLTFNDQFVTLQNSFDTGRCSLTGLHTYDRGQIDPERNDVFTWSNYAVGGRCVGFGSGSSAVVDGSMNVSYTRNAVGTADSPERDARLTDFAIKVDVSRPLGAGDLQGGVRVHYTHIGYTVGQAFNEIGSGNRVLIDMRGFGELRFPLGDRIDLRPGLAVTLPIDYELSLEPRLRVKWRPFGRESEQANLAVGYYRQPIAGISDERDLGSVFRAWVPAPFETGRQSAWHVILGWRQEVQAFGLTVEGYYKSLRNLAVPVFSSHARFTTDLTRAAGTVWGLDLRGEYERGPLYAYVGYGLSWTHYRAENGAFGRWMGTPIDGYHPPHDRRHEVNAVVSADLDVATLDLRWQFGAGLPYTQPFGFDRYLQFENLEQSPRSVGIQRILYAQPYRARLPAYHRLDVSLERTFDLGLVDVTTKAGGINIYDRQNLFYFDLFTHSRVNQLPFVPYVAVEIATDG